MAVLGVTLLGSAAAFYFIAPVFVREHPFAGYPTLAYMPTRTPKVLTPTLEPTEMPTQTPTPTTSVAIGVNPATLVVVGSFYPIVHAGSGQAAIYEVAEDEWVLELTDFTVEDGPDLHVYLAVQDPVPSEEGSPLADALDLGELKQISGDHRYTLPSDVQLENYHSVVIWCVPFNVPFIAASLN